MCACRTLPRGVRAGGRQFEPMEYDGLPYQQLAYNVKGAKKPSLVIFLHGGHARGNDNQAQIQLPAVRDIKDFILTSNIPAYFLVPQCPNGYEWISSRERPGCKEKVAYQKVRRRERHRQESGLYLQRVYGIVGLLGHCPRASGTVRRCVHRVRRTERRFRKTFRGHAALCDGRFAGTHRRSFRGFYFRDQGCGRESRV